MGNCCRRCFNMIYKRRVLRNYTRLDRANALNEGEELFDDADGDGLLEQGSSSRSNSQKSPAAITEGEKLLLKSKNYAAIIHSQKTFDDQIDKQLAEQEARLRREEEELGKLRRSRTQNNPSTSQGNKPTASPVNSRPTAQSTVPFRTDPWESGDNSEWNVAGGADDFDMFLDSIATRDRSKRDSVEEEINEEDFVSGFTPSS